LLDKHRSLEQTLWSPRWARAAFAIACLVSLPMLTSCGSPVGRATALYQQQNYIEAAEAFERTQGRLVRMEPVERARYGLYRGLTFMALGDLRGAERWFDYAEALQRLQPRLLPDEERVLLARGRRELSQRIRESWPKPEDPISQGVAATAVARDATVAR
jgi:tetratricopeptide (TPR) repeat protein